MFIKWLKLIDSINRNIFNDELEKIYVNFIDLGCEGCCKHMVKEVLKVVKEVRSDCKG